MTKIVCISDTHNLHHKLVMPEGDILIHSGDATMRGKDHEVENFLRWLDAQPYALKIFVPGNHDFLFDKNRSTGALASTMVKSLLSTYSSIVYLKDKEYHSEEFKLKFYGTPWVKGLEQWAFGWKSNEGREAEFAAIPPDTDVLVTHGPALGRLDTAFNLQLGDEVLADRLIQLDDLKLHVHGHIHYSYGVVGPPFGSTGLITVNAASCTEAYTATNPPIVVEL